MNLSSEGAVPWIKYENITNWNSLLDFNMRSIQLLPQICKGIIQVILANSNKNVQAKAEVLGANISSVSVHYLLVAVCATQYYY